MSFSNSRESLDHPAPDPGRARPGAGRPVDHRRAGGQRLQSSRRAGRRGDRRRPDRRRGLLLVAGEPDDLGLGAGDLAGADRCAHAPGEHALDPGRAGAVDRADGDDRGDLRLARGRQRDGCAGDRHAGGGLRGAAAGPVLHGVVVRARDGVGRRRRRARARARSRRSCHGPASSAWPR